VARGRDGGETPGAPPRSTARSHPPVAHVRPPLHRPPRRGGRTRRRRPARGRPAPARGPAAARAVRRDIPITDAIRRALAAGTRDSTGRPTARYWQLRTDYTIEARLDTATSRLSGRERVVIHNASPDTLRQIVLRLDPNIFRAETPKAAPWVPAEATEGMVITRLAVDGRAARLEVPARGRRAGRARTRSRPRAAAAERGRAQRADRVGPAVDRRARAARRAGAPRSARDARRRVAPQAARRPRRDAAPHDAALGRLALPAHAVVSARRRVRRPARWDTELYLGPSEFYNNFGRFDVRLDVPAGWLVSGTGCCRTRGGARAAAARASRACSTPTR
jgi:hypothetical protein